MTGVDIIDSWAAACAAPPQRTLDHLFATGVTPRAVIDAGGIAIAEVSFAEDKVLGSWFEFTDGGEPALSFRCTEDDWLIDIVAMDMKSPTRFARLERRAWALGPDIALSPNRLGDDPDRLPPIRIFRNPLTWLQGGCDGLVILDPDRARDELWRTSRLAGEDEVHGRQLKRLMVPPSWNGQVLVPRRTAA